MIRRAASLLLLFSLTLAALATEPVTEFIGVFLQNERIGLVTATTFDEPAGRRTVSTSRIHALILGQEMRLEIHSESWSDRNGRLTKQVFLIESGGREQKVTAEFTKSVVKVVREADGRSDKKELPIPPGALIVEDPTVAAGGEGVTPGDTRPGDMFVFYSFDPLALALLRGESEIKGQIELEVAGVKLTVFWVRVTDPRGVTDIYTSPVDGGLILAKTILGIELRPLTREEALGNLDYVPSIDLATATRVRPDKPIENPRRLSKLRLRLEGGELPRLAGSAHQTVERRPDGSILLTVHPYRISAGEAASIDEAGKRHRGFLKSVTFIPSGDSEMTRLAIEILDGETNSYRAAHRVARYVNRLIRPNATIAMLRDAREILKTKEGVCRDYSILTATLLRAAGIPAKLVTGAVYADGAFYYHAWVEAWTGGGWLALDPTLGGGLVDATHIKFAEGDPEEAFVVFTLDGVKIRVLEAVGNSTGEQQR
ncbi:MAG: transglutaminase domain-containing protein [Armatimonadetes bacterium]|nr:transglutaminase domain-containing protein [Armatimonadota bacterium]